MPLHKIDGKKNKDGLQGYNVRVNYTDNNGKARQLTRTAYGKEAATELLHKLTAEKKSNGGDAPAKKMTLQQLFDEYINGKQYEVREISLRKSRYGLEFHVLPTLKDVRVDRLSVKHLQDWKLSMEQKTATGHETKLSLNTKKLVYSELRAMLNYAVKMDYMTANPLKKIGNFTDTAGIKKEMQYYTESEFKQYISAARAYAEDRETTHGDLSGWDYYVFFNIAFYCGLRKGEMYALKWSDLTASHLSVKRSISQNVKKGKGNEEKGIDKETAPKSKKSIRTLQMPLPLIKILDEHKGRQAQLKDFSDDFRVCGGYACLRDNRVRDKNALFAELAGLKRIVIHEFRHSHVSVLANAGINIQEISRRLGHAKIEMTWGTYSHLYPQEEEKAVDILNLIA
jgi:integrase